MTIRAASLDFDSRKGYAEYSAAPGSRVTLDQEDSTSIGGNTVVIDQTKGDLTATGNATSRLMLDKKVSRGTAHEIRYSDEKRRITFASAPKAGAGPGEVSLISGPDSTIKAGSIDLTLATKENTLEQMKAARNVRLIEGQHTVESAARLDYRAVDETYVVQGEGTTPVVVITRDDCRRHSGESVTFSKLTDKVSVRTGSSKPLETGCTPSTRK